MKRRVALCAALLGIGLASCPWAASAAEVSALALPIAEPGEAQAALMVQTGLAPRTEALAWAPAPGRLEAVRYRPRRRAYREPGYGPRPETFSQFHVGFMDPDGPEKSGILFGLRGGLSPDPHVQFGGQFEWRHRSSSDAVVVSESPGPGGTVITTRRDLARSSSDLFPLLLFAQVSGGRDLPVAPYFGFAGGYEVLHLSADDFQTGEEFEGTFAGFGWQLWGGVSMPLSGRSRVNAEVFVNGAELSRDVEDAFSGQEFRETVDMDGTGARLGFAWGF